MTNWKIKPMLATKGPMRSSPDWIVERKYDGWRALIEISQGRTRIFSRQGNDMTDQFPLIAELHGLLPPCVLDAELFVVGKTGKDSLPLIQSSEGRKLYGVRVRFFDLLVLHGEDLRDLMLATRRKLLWSEVGLGAMPETLPAYAKVEDIPPEWEGVVCKRANSKYRAGRSDNWIKVKIRE